ncbi:MAG TPA: hypothetical protein DEG17_23500 [Cyanobacteria bacterium UBA11149]|nr:hypothetical protein [Cyanobacteria bacterium UBA11367]HBE60527.1 hypothetical protein [Cyanobacteria bacterium UBA11366]HBS72427.1 hypothetical protein [Cyanobacteria bacterium UBA11153]HBW91748.1 hypothetical protein [Cyanobacteria bacterium UBA11149]
MTNTPNPDNQPASTPTPPVKRFRWRRLWIGGGVVFVVVLASGMTAGWIFGQRFLAPMVAGNVAKLLNRPMKMGKVERLAWNSLRFGASELPATATDSDRATITAIEVAYNPLKLLFQWQLDLDVTLVKPNIYIEQDRDSRWIATEIQKLPEGRLKVNLRFLRLRHGSLVLVGRQGQDKLQSPVTVSLSGGKSQFLDDNRRIVFDASGKMGQDGNFAVAGEYLAPPQPEDMDDEAVVLENYSRTKLRFQGNHIDAVELGRLISLPLTLQAGKVGGDVEILFQPSQPLEFLGVASLSEVTARVPALPQAFAKTNGILRFQGTKVSLARVKTLFGQIPLEANGFLDTQTDFNLIAQTQPITPKQVLQTFGLKNPPVHITGMVQSTVKVTGPLAKPIVSGTVRTTKSTQIDKLNFRTITAGFKLDTSKMVAGLPRLEVTGFRAIPVVGGVVLGKGIVDLGEKGGLRFEVFGDKLPGNAIASIYNVDIPVPIGAVSGKAQFFGPLNNLRQLRATGNVSLALAGGRVNATNVQFLNPWLSAQVEAVGINLAGLAGVSGNFTGPFSGKLAIAINLSQSGLSGVASRGAGRLDLAGGRVNIDNLSLFQGFWQTSVSARDVDLGRLFPDFPLLRQIPVNANFSLTGPVDNFSIAKVNGRGNGDLAVAGGRVFAGDIQVGGGSWRSLIQLAGIDLKKLIPSTLFPMPDARFMGIFNTSGSLSGFSLASINISGGGQLQVAGGVVRISDVRVNGGKFSTNMETDGVALAELVPQLPPQFSGRMAGNFNVAGNLGNLALNSITVRGDGRVNFPGGLVKLGNFQLAEGKFRSLIQTDGIALADLVPQLPPQFAGSVGGNFQIAGNLANFSPTAIALSGAGTVNIGSGSLNLGDLALADGKFRSNIGATNLDIGNLIPQIPPQLAGIIDGRFSVAGNLANFSPTAIAAKGSATLNIGDGTVNLWDLALADGKFRTNIQTDGIELAGLVPQLPPQFTGTLAGNLNLTGNLANLLPTAITGKGSARLNIGNDSLNLSNIEIAAGKFHTNIQTDGIELAGLVPQLPPQLTGTLAGNLNLTGNLANLSPTAITGKGNARLNIGNDSLNLSNIEIAAGKFHTNIQTDGINLADLVPQLPGNIAGNFNLTGNLENLSPNNISGNGNGKIEIASGAIAANDIILNNGNIQATLTPTNIELAKISPQLQGILNGTLNIRGNLNNFSPNTIARNIRIDGKLNFSQGLPGIKGPLATEFQWQGNGIQIQQATAPELSAHGFIGINPNFGANINAITQINLNIDAQNLNLGEISAYLPAAPIQLGGGLDFHGIIEGTLISPNIQGKIALKNFNFNGMEFEALLGGEIETRGGKGIEIKIEGERDTIKIALDRDYLPRWFKIKQGEAIARGRRREDILEINTEKFPIEIIQKVSPLPAAIATQKLSGYISGKVKINLRTFDLDMEEGIAIAGEIFKPQEENTNNPADSNQYTIISGKLKSTPQGPEFQGNIDIVKGQLPVLVALWQLFDASKAQLNFPTTPEITQVGLPKSPLEIQLRRFSEITALLTQEKAKRKEISPLPEISEIQGIFTGNIKLNINPSTGINAEFNIQGKDWKWGGLPTSQVTANGTFKDGILTLLPVEIKLGGEENTATFSGTIGGAIQSGKLELKKVPIALIREFVNLPPAIGFGGKINGSANLAGNLANPQARGEFTVDDASLNQEKVKSFAGSFSYENARLNFDAESILADNSDPIKLTGSIPYKLPFPDTVSPENNELNLDINVKDKGLAILDILSRQQIAWVDGKGEIKVNIKGKLDLAKNRPTELKATGSAIFSDATIAAQSIPEELTKVNGEIQLEFDKIDVKKFSGYFGGGEITASGTIPIYEPVSQPNPLSINIPDLTLNLKGRYSGAVKGNIILSGAAFAPVLGGKIELFNGKIPLPDQPAETANVNTSSESDNSIPIEFNNLEITLGKNTQIRQAPILNFLAEGILTINGSFNNIKPKGEIDLRRGQVNIFTTQFRLSRGYNNKARFIPDRGFDPELDVELVTSVAEATQRRLPTNPQSAEISDTVNTSFGSVQTVRVQAKVIGPASQLADRLELTSIPSRSESEIVALLGGSFVDTFGTGDSTLGLANLAGSAILGDIGNFIGDTLRLSEFRLFPTIITNDERRTSSLGIAAEAGIDITRNLSISVLKELTTDQPAQYNLRYRINDNLLLRGGTDFSGDSRAVIEYEQRF